MFAQSRSDIPVVLNRLLDDSLIQHQQILIREFEQFKTYGNDFITKAPIIDEYRCFFYKNKLLAKGFYWSNHIEEIGFEPNNNPPKEWLDNIANIVSDYANFWVADIAQKENGEWKLIETNDAQQSGLSGVDPKELYSNLKEADK